MGDLTDPEMLPSSGILALSDTCADVFLNSNDDVEVVELSRV
jgi:hypothetical protein